MNKQELNKILVHITGKLVQFDNKDDNRYIPILQDMLEKIHDALSILMFSNVLSAHQAKSPTECSGGIEETPFNRIDKAKLSEFIRKHRYIEAEERTERHFLVPFIHHDEVTYYLKRLLGLLPDDPYEPPEDGFYKCKEGHYEVLVSVVDGKPYKLEHVTELDPKTIIFSDRFRPEKVHE